MVNRPNVKKKIQSSSYTVIKLVISFEVKILTKPLSLSLLNFIKFYSNEVSKIYNVELFSLFLTNWL